MAQPAYDLYIYPLLKLLGSSAEGLRSSTVYTSLADELKLTADERAALLPSGTQPVHQNRIGWARDRLRRAGLAESASRGLWRLTDDGRRFLAEHPNGLSAAERRNLMRGETHDPGEMPTEQVGGAESTAPEERIDAAVAELHESLSRQLLALIGRSSPTFFEQLVLDVLKAMGYGTTSDDSHTGGPGDEGFDGIIHLDKLGFEKVYVQAKRWQNTVGRPQLQAFYGALAGRRARKGVFITTSSFSRDASEFAEQVSDSIVLIDGQMLTAFMIDFGVGVSSQRTVKIGRIDQDYFDEL